MTKARTRTARFPQHIREDAFAYYCAWHTRTEVVHRLRRQYGDRVPSPATVKRWMEQGRWTARRRRIEDERNGQGRDLPTATATATISAPSPKSQAPIPKSPIPLPSTHETHQANDKPPFQP